VSIGLLAWVWLSVDWPKLTTEIPNVQWLPWLAGVALVVAAPVLGSARIHAIARCAGQQVGFAQLLDLNLRAMRFVFLPGGDLLGGAARWYGMTQWRWSGADAFGILALERLLDLGVIAAIVAVTVPLGGVSEPLLRAVWLASLVAIAGVVAGLALGAALAPHIRAAASATHHRGRVAQTVVDLVVAIATTAASLVRSPRWLLRTLGASAAYWLLALLGGVLIARGAVPDLDLVHYTLTLCLVSLAAQLPISVAGAGLREAMLSLLMASHGITPEKAVLIGTSALVPYAVLSCIGIALAASQRRTE
jgi:uncharacterized membrane protein YbhN (UPF0104 family)